jgi:hypothetical protein
MYAADPDAEVRADALTARRRGHYRYDTGGALAKRRHFAWSPTRLMKVGRPPDQPHPDERLRATAPRRLD